MNTFDYIVTIHRSLSGQITVEEQQQLDQWFEADPAHKVMAQEVALIWRAARAYQVAQLTDDTEGALSRFQKARAATTVQTTPAAKVVNLSTRRSMFKLAAGVAAALVLGLFLYTSDSSQSEVAVSTAMGQKETTKLKDGSTIYINETSVLEFPEQFATDAREVTLKGEAFFEVAKDASRPFLIATDQLEVKVLGTSFNVYAYPHKRTEEVVVASGKVAVTSKAFDKEYLLEAGDHLIYDKENKTVHIRKDDHQNAQAWRTGVLTFGATPLTEVCQSLEKYFNISVQIKNEAMLNCPFTGPAFNKATPAIVLKTIQTAFGMELQQKGTNSYELSGGACE
jgi:ferric-dicitrate binding protein FerR (iron transport regulator)